MSVAHDHDFSDGWGPYRVEDLHSGPDDGRGYELWNGWLIEKMSPSARHNRVADGLREVFVEAARRAGTDVFIGGGEYEFALPSGVRKPDVFILDGAAERAAVLADDTFFDPGDLELVAEVVSPRSGSEPHDRVFKRDEYARAGIPQYWIVEFKPIPRIEVLVRNSKGHYETGASAIGDRALTVTAPFEITVVPTALLGLNAS